MMLGISNFEVKTDLYTTLWFAQRVHPPGDLRSLINNLKVTYMELLALHIRIVSVVVVVLHPLPHVLEATDRFIFLLVLRNQTQPLEHRRRSRFDIDIVARPHEVEETQSMNVILVLRRADNTVGGRFEISSRPKVQCVADITDDATVDGRNVFPLAARCLQLETGDGLIPEQRQRAEVSVRPRPAVVDLGIICQATGVVDHVSEMILAWVIVPVSRREVVLWKFEDNGTELKDLAGKFKGALRMMSVYSLHHTLLCSPWRNRLFQRARARRMDGMAGLCMLE